MATLPVRPEDGAGGGAAVCTAASIASHWDRIAVVPREATAAGKAMGLPGGRGSPIESMTETVVRLRA